MNVAPKQALTSATNHVISSWAPGNALLHWHANLKKHDLYEVPSWIFLRQNLHVLNLSENKLIDLPVEIAKLASLRELVLDDNRLRDLPCELSRLTLLQRLHVSSNKLDELPHTFHELTQLRELKLNRNALRCLFADDNQTRMPHLQVCGSPFRSFSLHAAGSARVLSMKKRICAYPGLWNAFFVW
jgi:Leucine-rich repeat (LRR) protein